MKFCHLVSFTHICYLMVGTLNMSEDSIKI